MILNDIHQNFKERFSNSITTIDSHTAGEYTRLIVHGLPDIPGHTMPAKREHFITHLDSKRLILTREPRGNKDVVVAAVTEPATPGASFGLIYMDACRYPYLCGHATIGAVTTLIETGLIKVKPDQYGQISILVDTPSGPMPVQASSIENKISSVSFLSVPCFVLSTQVPLFLPGTGEIKIDLVCAGGFFAMVDLNQHPFKAKDLSRSQLINLGMSITQEACKQLKVIHPLRPEVSTVDVTEFYRHDDSNQGTSTVIYGESHMDRSPCGTGTAAKMALFFSRGLIKKNEIYVNKGPLETAFNARVTEETKTGSYPAVIVEITGSAHITGLHQFVLDNGDPFPQGFLL